MSFSFGNFAGGSPTSPSRFAGGQTRGRIQGSHTQGINYPSPFFDIAHTYLPTSMKQMFKFCRYYALTNPLINAVIWKMSEYPVTDIVVDHEDPEVVRKWTDYMHDTIRLRSFQVECGLDFHCYGTSALSLSFPFQKYLTCRNCGFSEQARKIRDRWVYTSHSFRLNCPKCGHTGSATPKDWYYQDASSIRPVRWNVEDIEVSYNDITGDCTYFYTIPAPLRADITLGKKDTVESMPQIFLQAIRQQKGVVFSKGNFFALKRATLAWQDRGWGIPMILPVLKDAFYLQVMKKAQEAILVEHIVPLRVIFPQAGSGTSDPYTTISLVDWRDQMAAEIARWRHDCVAPKSLVETADGVMYADEVVEGTLLRNHLGGYSPVEKVWRRSLRDGELSYRVHVRGLHGVAPVVSEGHPLLAARSLNQGNEHELGEATFIRAKDLKPGDYIGYPTKIEEVPFAVVDLAQFTDRTCTDDWCYVDHTSPGVPRVFEALQRGAEGSRAELCAEYGCSTSQFKTAQNAVRAGRVLRRVPRYVLVTDDLLWVFGVYLAEGSATDKQVLFAASKKERSEYDRVYSVMQSTFGVNGFEAEGGCQHVFSSVVAAQVFSALCGGVATTKKVHERLMHLPLARRATFISGLFFGDGCNHNDEKGQKRTYTSASASLACGVQRLLLSLGVAASVSYVPPAPYQIQGKSGVSAGSYRVGVYGESNDKLSLWFSGADTASTAAARMGVFRDGYFWFRVTDVEEEHTSEVLGFQMSQEEARVRLEDDAEAHGTFCLAGMACANSNYIPIMPLPIGNQSIGGDGRALLLSGEMQQLGEQIIMGMGVPREFLQGGLSYSGTNVSMRMLENAFLSYIGRQRQMVNWIVELVAHFMGWPKVNVRFKPFKMADDLQRKSYLFQLNQSQKVSDTTLLADADLDVEEENDIMVREADRRLEATKKSQLAMAQIQGESQIIMMKMQAKAQQAMQQAQAQPPAPGEPGVPGNSPQEAQAQMLAMASGQGGGSPGAPPGQSMMSQPSDDMEGGMSASVPAEATSQLHQEQGMESPDQMPVDITALAEGYAVQILALPDEQKQMALQAIEAQSPELLQLVLEMMQLIGTGQMGSPLPGVEGAGPETGGIDQRALPEVHPPRRETSLV